MEAASPSNERHERPLARAPRRIAVVAPECTLSGLLAEADIRCDGRRPWDIDVIDPRFHARVLDDGSLGLGEAYMDEWWECEALDEFCFRALRARLDERAPRSAGTLFATLVSMLVNRQTKRGSRKVGKVHYDLGNDFFQAMLDPAMQYSCACFREADSLEEAQRAKMDLICRKLRLEPGMRLLDIGCGWGGLLRHAAQHYGCNGVGVTVSEEQKRFADAARGDLPVEIRLQDYRDVNETFDRIVSVGMLEHVGEKNYQTYFRAAARCLQDDGLFLCHSITANTPSPVPDPWIATYIFPNSQLPAASQVLRAAERFFVLEDVENLGTHYDRTLLAWEENFRNAWPRFEARYGRRFYRMWRFYLLTCAGAFRARAMQLEQFVLSRRGIVGGWSLS